MRRPWRLVTTFSPARAPVSGAVRGWPPCVCLGTVGRLVYEPSRGLALKGRLISENAALACWWLGLSREAPLGPRVVAGMWAGDRGPGAQHGGPIPPAWPCSVRYRPRRFRKALGGRGKALGRGRDGNDGHRPPAARSTCGVQLKSRDFHLRRGRIYPFTFKCPQPLSARRAGSHPFLLAAFTAAPTPVGLWGSCSLIGCVTCNWFLNISEPRAT